MSPSNDRISLRGLRFLGRHGVTLEERLEPQPIEVDVVLEADLSRAAASDELGDTVDYAALFDTVASIVEGRSFRLLEALAGAIADAVLAGWPVDGVKVSVRKPQAPLPGTFESVGVSLRRRRAPEA